jgi:hypothetical protein
MATGPVDSHKLPETGGILRHLFPLFGKYTLLGYCFAKIRPKLPRFTLRRCEGFCSGKDGCGNAVNGKRALAIRSSKR